MSKPDDGGPAFPSPPVYVDENMSPRELDAGDPGMNLREFYSGLAMHGILAGRPGLMKDLHPRHTALCAVEFADAMILALKPREEPDPS